MMQGLPTFHASVCLEARCVPLLPQSLLLPPGPMPQNQRKPFLTPLPVSLPVCVAPCLAQTRPAGHAWLHSLPPPWRPQPPAQVIDGVAVSCYRTSPNECMCMDTSGSAIRGVGGVGGGSYMAVAVLLYATRCIGIKHQEWGGQAGARPAGRQEQSLGTSLDLPNSHEV